MSQQFIHAMTVVTRTYCLIEEGSIVRQFPIEARCTKPTDEELIDAGAKIEAKWAEMRAEIEAEAAHEEEHIRNGRQRTPKKRVQVEEPAAAG